MNTNKKEVKCSSDLEKCRKGIEREKELISFHKDLLKKLEKKEAAIQIKLEKLKMASFMEMINQHGYDIDNLRKAVSDGDFNEISVQKLNDESIKEPTVGNLNVLPVSDDNKNNESVKRENNL